LEVAAFAPGALIRRGVRVLGRIALIAASSGLVTGCQWAVNPFADEFQAQPPVTTASVDGVHASGLASAIRVRPYEGMVRGPLDGSVIHGPLYFEDPFETKGSEDGRFAWTWEDYLQVFYWRGRFLLNAVFIPVSAVVQPPWTDVSSGAGTSAPVSTAGSGASY
jgi:hypothetical protein